MEKIIKLNDKISSEDMTIINQIDFGSPKGTSIIIRDKTSKEILYEGHNKTVIAGSEFIATKLWGIPNKVTFPNYNNELQIDELTRSASDNEPLIWGFCVGISGCGSGASDLYPVNALGHIPSSSLVPFRYEKTVDIDDDMRDIYFGRKYIDEHDRYAYYFKRIENKQLHLEYTDGTEITSAVYASTSTLKGLCYVEASLTITKSDCRDIFASGDFTPTLADGSTSPALSLADARINTLSLLQGWYKTGIDGYRYYYTTQPVTQINFPNISLIDSTLSVEIIYKTFY